ncbi:MAG: sulfotransferase [Solidesulfovibrio sp.]|uniref:sulfotransferase n=1 Tax=Solidesulfovibrio sp. TaxID=2910990 RepID=UPI002B1F011F|nr:sulfotransferase [Solidesulfovibrio sp.]MEA4858208.1 sulfotransferase family 2 domain-containing protein [Solidesulfovibrio sp.]
MAGEPPFLFLHLPRTAGTTLNRLLERRFAPQEVLSLYSRDDFARNAVVDRRRLDGLRLIQGHVLLTDYEAFTFYDAPVRVFTFLREPVARVISEYFFLRTWPGQHLYPLLNEPGMDLAAYVTSGHKLLRYKGANFMTRVLSGLDPDARPQAALERAMENLRRRFVCFGLTERFDESLLLLADVLGLTDLLYERQNVLRRPEAERATTEERALVAARNSLDTALHAFAVTLFEERLAAGGAAFAARLARHRQLLGRFQKLCRLLDARAGKETGAIDNPKG